jgi:hypothetical protein
MKEEKIDRFIRKTMNDGYMENPSSEFTENVMGKLGVSNQGAKLKTKPIKSKWGLRSMILIYLILMVAILLLPGTLESGAYQLPKFELPSLGKYFTLDGNISKLLIMLILGGWFLIFIDNYLKKFFTR